MKSSFRQAKFESLLLVLLTLASFIDEAMSFEVAPLRTTPSAFDFQVAPNPNALSSEYSSDILTYALPIQWECAWRKTENKSANEAEVSIQHSAGSLSTFHLAHNGRSHSLVQLSDSFQIGMNTYEQSDYESESGSILPYLKWGFLGGLHFQLMSSVHFQKRNTDIGGLLGVRLEEHSIQLEAGTFLVDYPRNEHSDDDSEFTLQPYSHFFQIVRTMGDSCLGFSGRVETPGRLKSGNEKSTVEFSRKTFFAYAFHKLRLAGLQSIGARLEHSDRQHIELNVSNRLRKSKAQLEAHFDENRVPLKLGLYAVQRIYTSNNKRFVGSEIIPYIGAQFRNIKNSEHGISLSFDSSHSFTENQGWKLKDPDKFSNQSNQRVNLRWIKEFASSKGSELSFLISFDLDEKGTRRRFEGGSLRAGVSF